MSFSAVFRRLVLCRASAASAVAGFAGTCGRLGLWVLLHSPACLPSVNWPAPVEIFLFVGEMTLVLASQISGQHAVARPGRHDRHGGISEERRATGRSASCWRSASLPSAFPPEVTTRVRADHWPSTPLHHLPLLAQPTRHRTNISATPPPRTDRQNVVNALSPPDGGRPPADPSLGLHLARLRGNFAKPAAAGPVPVVRNSPAAMGEVYLAEHR